MPSLIEINEEMIIAVAPSHPKKMDFIDNINITLKNELKKKIEKVEHLDNTINNQVDSQGDIVIYQAENGETKIDVRFVDDTVWLTQAQLCELYQTSKSNVSEHIRHIFEEGELEETSVVRKFRTTAVDGKLYNVTYYNLDMIISLGYRVKSRIATSFRRWASERLKEYMLKGFTMDDERLKNLGGGNYWKELLDRIRDIRSSEKVMYRQVLDLYATSVDYVREVRSQLPSSRWCRINFTMQLADIQQLKLSMRELMQISRLWG